MSVTITPIQNDQGEGLKIEVVLQNRHQGLHQGENVTAEQLAERRLAEQSQALWQAWYAPQNPGDSLSRKSKFFMVYEHPGAYANTTEYARCQYREHVVSQGHNQAELTGADYLLSEVFTCETEISKESIDGVRDWMVQKCTDRFEIGVRELFTDIPVRYGNESFVSVIRECYDVQSQPHYNPDHPGPKPSQQNATYVRP